MQMQNGNGRVTNKASEGTKTVENASKTITLTKEELGQVIAQAVQTAIKGLAEEGKKPAPKPMSVDEAKAAARTAADSIGKGIVDCAKIAGGGILGALDELFTAGIKIGLRATGRMQ